MNRFKQMITGSRDHEEGNKSLEETTNSIVPHDFNFSQENQQHTNGELQEREKWIQWHENA